MNAPAVLILNHAVEQCGVYQFGRATANYLSPSSAVRFVYREVGDAAALRRVLDAQPWDVIIVNFHPDTMPWLTRTVVRSVGAPVVGILHEFDHSTCFVAHSDRFAYRILPDPTVDSRVPGVFAVPRVAPPFEVPPRAEGGPVVVGSFGLGTPGKGFERIVSLAQREFDRVIVRLHIPSSRFADPSGERACALAARCRAQVHRAGVEVEVSHDFKDDAALLEFLAGNSVNVFLYEGQRGRGVSSAIDLAVAAGRPIGVSDSTMFRCLLSAVPGSRLETATLSDILAAGSDEVLALKRVWTPEALREAYERIVTEVIDREAAQAAGAPSYNCVLDDEARRRYQAATEELHRLAPGTIARKIELANVQQAFVKEAVERFTRGDRSAAILCVGAFEDTACHALQARGYHVDEVDPAINYSLDDYVRRPTTPVGSYDVVFSTSVLEHVGADEEFVAQIARLLRPGGVAIFTLDFKEGYRPGDPKPIVDERLYTQADLLGRLLFAAPDLELVDVPAWLDAEPDFDYEEVRYCFATYVLQKRRRRSTAAALQAQVNGELTLLRQHVASLEVALAVERERARSLRRRLAARVERVVRRLWSG